MVTPEQLTKLKIKPDLAQAFNETFAQWGIDTPVKQAAFIGQCGHECRNFTKLEEDLHYRAETLLKHFARTPKRPWGFTPEEAKAYERQPQRIANRIYGNRMGNRGEESGDGYRFRGSGWLQLTGHDNFYHAGKACGVDFVMNPDLVRTPQYAAITAGWFWATHKCNEIAQTQEWRKLTKIINGGDIGLDDRIFHTQHALAVLTA